MILKLVRKIFTDNSTIGYLYVNGELFGYTLEDFDRKLTQKTPNIEEKIVRGKTAIPSGYYKIVITYSPRFKVLMPLLLDVPGFSGIRIHAGNWANDTEGCILPGTGYKEDMVMNSREAYNKLYLLIEEAIEDGKEVWISVEYD